MTDMRQRFADFYLATTGDRNLAVDTKVKSDQLSNRLRPATRHAAAVGSQPGDLQTMHPRQLGTGMSVTTARQALLGSLFGSPATAQLSGDTA